MSITVVQKHFIYTYMFIISEYFTLILYIHYMVTIYICHMVSIHMSHDHYVTWSYVNILYLYSCRVRYIKDETFLYFYVFVAATHYKLCMFKSFQNKFKTCSLTKVLVFLLNYFWNIKVLKFWLYKTRTLNST